MLAFTLEEIHCVSKRSGIRLNSTPVWNVLRIDNRISIICYENVEISKAIRVKEGLRVVAKKKVPDTFLSAFLSGLVAAGGGAGRSDNLAFH